MCNSQHWEFQEKIGAKTKTKEIPRYHAKNLPFPTPPFTPESQPEFYVVVCSLVKGIEGCAVNLNLLIEFPDLVVPSADATVWRQWRGGNFHACGHFGQQMAMFLSFTSRCQARRPLEMQGVFIRWLLNQLKICKGMVDQLLFIYFYLELMNSVKFHNGQMNTVCLCWEWE